jgi:hypothetical protein
MQKLALIETMFVVRDACPEAWSASLVEEAEIYSR